MKTYEFKKLEINQNQSWLQRTFTSAHVRKTILYSLSGAAIGYVLFLLSNRFDMQHLWGDEASKNMIMGALMGIFITNSPCARGRC